MLASAPHAWTVIAGKIRGSRPAAGSSARRMWAAPWHFPLSPRLRSSRAPPRPWLHDPASSSLAWAEGPAAAGRSRGRPQWHPRVLGLLGVSHP